MSNSKGNGKGTSLQWRLGYKFEFPRKKSNIYLKEGKHAVCPPPPNLSFFLLRCTLGSINVDKFAQGGGGV